MDFLALPRRDLQALCKRNGVRANMTSAAMADALRALPKVDGIEEYVKQPVPVPQPEEVEAVVEEEQNVGKQGSLPPRGRGRSSRTVAKSSEPIETKEDKGEEKGNAERQSSKEDAPALGVARRGASRRARPVPVVPQTAAVAEEEGQGEENLMREAKRDNAPAPVAGRRGASRRGRPSPAMAAQAAESEVAGAEEEKREEVEDTKRKATMDDVQALGAGRRGANRRARAAPSVAALGGKASSDALAAEEEQGAQIPCGRRVTTKGTSSEPIRLDDSDDEELEDAKPEQQEEETQILGQRGGASRRAQAAPAAAAPEAKAEEEQRAPVPRGRRVKANTTEEHTKPEEERGDVPAIAAGRHGASRRAPAPSEAPATRRSAAASKADAGDVAVEAAPIRATRQRKPTMKAAAAAAAEEKAPRRGTRRGEVMSSLMQQEVHEEPHEAVGAPNMAVVALPIRATRQRKPTMKAAAAVTAEEKLPPRATRRGAVMKTVLHPEVQEEPQEVVDASVSNQRCDAMEELADASDPQKEELIEENSAKQDEDQDLVITDDEKLMEETPAEEAFVTDQECTDKSEIEEQLVVGQKCHAPMANNEESPITDSTVTEQASEYSEEAVDALLSHQQCDAMEELTDASDPQKKELNELNSPKQEKDQDVVINDDEMLMEKTPTEEAPVSYQECMDKFEILEHLVDGEKCHGSMANHEESPILGLDSMVTKQAFEDSEEAVDASDSHQRCDAMEELADVSYPQKEELNEVDGPKQDEDQGVVISGDETPTEEASVTDNAQEEPEEAVGALVSYQRCDGLEELAEASDPQNKEVNEVNALKRDQDQDLVILEISVTHQECTDEPEMQEQLVDDEKRHAPLANHEESSILDLVSTVTEQGSEDSEEIVDAPVSPQRSDAMEELADASDPQKEELNEFNSPKQDEDQDVIMIEDEKPMEEIITDEPSVTHQQSTDNSEMQEQQVDDKKGHALLATHMESPILGFVSTVTEQASKDKVSASFQDDEGSCSGLLDKGVCEETYDASKEMELEFGNQTLEAPLTGNQSDACDANHEIEIGNLNEVLSFREEISEDDTREVSKKEHMDIVLLPSDIVDEAGFLDCSSNISQVAEEINEQTNEEINTEDGFGCQEEGDVVFDKVLHDWVDNTRLLDCSSDISLVEMEKAGSVTSEMPENRATLDEDGDEQVEVIITDKVVELTGSNVENVGEKNIAEPMAVLEEKGVKVASEGEDLNKLSLRQLKDMYKEKMIAKENKEAKKRVALGRVDGNVCRSNAKGQQQNLNRQQH